MNIKHVGGTFFKKWLIYALETVYFIYELRMYSESQIYEYIARDFIMSYSQMPRKNEFNIEIAVLHISGLLIYLELKIKSSFLRIIINFRLYNDIWMYFHKSYLTLKLRTSQQLSFFCRPMMKHYSCHKFLKINFKTTFYALLLRILICEILILT